MHWLAVLKRKFGGLKFCLPPCCFRWSQWRTTVFVLLQVSSVQGVACVVFQMFLIFLNSHSGGWSPNWVHSARRPLIVPAPGDCEDGEFGGMKIGRGNRTIRRKPTPAAFCPPQIPLYQTRAWTRAAAVESQRLTAWAMARPISNTASGC
jgi:hypothetical protein